jgi:2-methylcitrate dehydratase PrpD
LKRKTGRGVAQQLAEEVIRFKFRDLPPEVVHQAKRLVLDTLGCAIGGYSTDASRIMREVITDLDGPKEATVVGSGMRTSCLNATLANGVMVRCLDYNDAVVMETETGERMGYHPSEVIPGILALGEREHLTGKETLTAIAIIDRQLGPDQFSPKKYSDPRVHKLIEKVVFEGDKAIDALFFCAGSSGIVMKDGRRYRCEVKYPKGHPRNPMTDAEIVDKFRSMAVTYMDEKQVSKVVRTVFELERLEDIQTLNKLMVFRQPSTKTAGVA